MNMVASPEAAVYYPTTLAAGDKLAPCQDEPRSTVSTPPNIAGQGQCLD